MSLGASLYVGNLHTDVDEAMLYEKFSSVGRILSIRVCRHTITRQSLAYAYVNFEQPSDAELALDTMNFEIIKGSPIRIMWSQRDPSLRKSGVGNVFIKNLDKSIDSNTMYDIFSPFGYILSCQIAQDENGKSKGYGFVHFDTQEAANKSIEKMNGMLLNGMAVYVSHFIPKKAKRFTNVYVKDFDEDFTEEMLKGMFEKYGRITSHKIMREDDGKSRGFGFVAFEDPNAAQQAITELNGKELVEGKAIYVGRAQRKPEREQELKRKFELLKIDHLNQGVNLYVKHLDDTIDDKRLHEEFMQFGTITSAKVMFENGRSKGFGFVSFSTPEEATKAITHMNGYVVGKKSLYVALAQCKEERMAHFASHTANIRLANIRMSQMGQIIQSNNTNGFFMPVIPQTQRFYKYGQVPRWSSVHQMRPNTQGGTLAYPGMQYAFSGASRGSGQASAMRNVSSIGGPIIGQQSPNMQGRIAGPAGGVNTNTRSNNYKYAANMHNPLQQMPINQQPSEQQVAHIKGQESFTAKLAAASLQEQKQMLGERLFPLTELMCPDSAGKITGMLLELDNSELLYMLEDNEALKAKVQEAVAVLEAHLAKQKVTTKIEK